MIKLVLVCFALAIGQGLTYKILPIPATYPAALPGPARIFNGTNACKGQLPWQALLDIDNGGLCGGSLISDQWVLTAGHCIQGYSKFIVKLGSVLYNQADPDRATLVPSKVLAHENFDLNTLSNDIGLIMLPTCITLNYNIKPIQLASCELETGSNVVVSGWGGTNANLDSPQNLMFTSLETITNKECQATFGTFVQSYMVCALNKAAPTTSSCQGDSGGPLVANLDTDPTLVGIVSFVNGVGCGKPYASGYTRVAAFRNWIRDNSGV